MGLYQTDVIPMGWGVEVRCPFMDRELIEWSTRVPLKTLFHPLKNKPFLRARLSHIVPDWIVESKKKPFYIPLGQWFAGPLAGYLQDMLSSERLKVQGILSPKGVNRLIAEHLKGTKDNSFKLLVLLVFVHWYEQVFMDKRINYS